MEGTFCGPQHLLIYFQVSDQEVQQIIWDALDKFNGRRINFAVKKEIIYAIENALAKMEQTQPTIQPNFDGDWNE